MKKLATLMALIAVAALLLIAAPQQAQARPQYAKALAKKYEKVAEAVGEKKCNVCHGMENDKSNKKLLSDYGKALKEALDKKNVKDEGDIEDALDKVAEKEAADGKTYGELLEDGKLPAPHESIKEE